MADRTVNVKITTDATAAIAGIQKFLSEMKTVGAKTDAEFDALRQHLQKTYASISQSATASANDIRRAQEATAAKISTLNKQQYGEQTSLLSTLKANWFAAAAAIAAAMVVINKAWNLAKTGAEFEEQKGILDNLSKKYSTTATSIVDSMRKASQGLIANSDLMQIALGGIGKGMSPDQMIKLAGAAEILGDVVGQNTTEALKSLSEALESGQAKALKGYAGTTIDLTAAFGDLAGKMTAAEKAQAMYALIMIHATKLQNEQTSAVGTAADKIELMEAKYKNAMLTIQTYSKTALVWIYDVIKNMSFIPDKTATTGPGVYTVPEPGAEGKADPIKEYEKQIAVLKKLLQARKDDTDAKKKSESDAERAAKEAQRAIETATKSAVEATRKANSEIDSVGLSQYQKDLAQIKAEADKYREAGVSKVIVAKFVAAETELATRKSFEVDAADRKKIYDEQVKASEDYRKMVADEQSFSVDKHTAAMLKITANEETKLLAAEKLMDVGKISWDQYQEYLVLVQKNTALATADSSKQELLDKANFYSTITGYENTYRQKMIAFIDAQLAADIAAGEDSVAATQKAEEAKLQYANTYFSGVQIGLNSIYKDYEDVGKSMTEVTRTAFSDMTSALVDFVKTGKLNFESLIDNMITGLIKLMVQQQLAGLAKSGGGFLSNLFGNTNTGTGVTVEPSYGDISGGGYVFGSAKGNIFEGGNLIPFARGGIVNRPTIFPMARGAGLMGEAGPEAVMPLTRLAGGDLGVRSVGGGGGEVTVNIINNAGAQVTQTQKETPRGLEIDVMIDQLVAKKLSQRGSSSNRTIRSNFGAREVLIAR